MKGPWQKFIELFRPKTADNNALGTRDPLEILQVSYRDLLHLARQIEAQVETAPYPHVTERLRRIASEKRENAQALRQKIVALGDEPADAPGEIRLGKNHWERINQAIDDQRRLEHNFLERAALLAEDAPEICDLLRNIVGADLPHKDIFLDLLARADPQAYQT